MSVAVEICPACGRREIADEETGWCAECAVSRPSPAHDLRLDLALEQLRAGGPPSRLAHVVDLGAQAEARRRARRGMAPAPYHPNYDSIYGGAS